MKKAYEIGFGETRDELIVNNLRVQGRIPDWVTGDLIRNGPGTFRVGEEFYRHWFDGLAMLHKFSVRDGQVGYANKFLRCKAYNEARETGRISYSEFATDPCDKLFSRLKTLFTPKLTDSAKVNVARFDNRYMALGETPMQIEFDRETLDTLGVFKYDEQNSQHVTTVHPHFDRTGGQIYNLVIRFSRVSFYNLREIANGVTRTITKTKVNKPAYIHSFGMSPRYLVLVEFPFRVYPLNILLSGKPFIENYQWKPDLGTRFYVFDRNSGELVTSLKTDAFFAFHHVNAFEKNGELFVDMAVYPDAGIIQAFYLEKIKQQAQRLPGGRLKRYRIDVGKNSIRETVLSDEDIELPRFDYDNLNMNGDYRYVYAAAIQKDSQSSFYDKIVKMDLLSGKNFSWHQDGCYPGEAVFVGRPGRTREDDGVIFSVVLDENKGTSFLLVLDAESFTEIARAEIPQPVLFGYHGEFFQ